MPRSRDRRATRARPDACPGAWRRHEAADGALARFRPVGGATTARELRLLAGAAASGGAPLELTSRGSWQVRALAGRTADDLADTLSVSGDPAALLDGSGRDVPCSLIASPRSTRLDEPAARVAAGLRGRTDVPGRLLVALEDRVSGGTSLAPDVRDRTRSTGDVSGQGADVTVVLTSDDIAALLLDGTDTGRRHDDPAALALATVDAFATHRGTAWRVRELDDAARDAMLADLDVVTTAIVGNDFLHPGPADPTRLGPAPDGTLEVLPRLGEVDAVTAGALVALLDEGATLRATPWRTLVLRGLTDPPAAADRLAGLVETDPASRWRGLSACVGAPRCAKSLSDVRGDLAAGVASGHVGGTVRQHWVGCGRACGTPGGRVAVVEAVIGNDETRGTYRTVVRSGKVIE